MDSVIVGHSTTRTAHYHLDGVLADPDNPTITIRDPNNIVVVNALTPTRQSTGIYTYVYALPSNATLGDFTDVWDGSFFAVPITGNNTETWRAIAAGSVTFPNGTYTYDLGTSVGILRLLISDTDLTSVADSLPAHQRSAAFTDEELAQFLTITVGEMYHAASLALRAWAANHQLLVQNRDFGQGKVDYGQARADLLKMADAYYALALQVPADAIAEMAWTPWGGYRIILNAWQRAGVTAGVDI